MAMFPTGTRNNPSIAEKNQKKSTRFREDLEIVDFVVGSLLRFLIVSRRGVAMLTWDTSLSKRVIECLNFKKIPRMKVPNPKITRNFNTEMPSAINKSRKLISIFLRFQLLW